MEEENKKDIYGIIYCAKNIVNGKCYIGKTTSILSRRKTEHYCSAKGHHYNSIFGSAIRKYGNDGFEWTVLEECYSSEELNRAEIKNIELLKSTNSLYGYNIAKGGTGGRIVEDLPNKEEIYKKRGLAVTGEKNGFFGKSHPPEIMKRIAESNIGRVQSQETRDKRSKSLKDRYFSPEHREKISNSKKGAGNAAFGKKMSQEQKDKIKQSMLKHRASKKESL